MKVFSSTTRHWAVSVSLLALLPLQGIGTIAPVFSAPNTPPLPFQVAQQQSRIRRIQFAPGKDSVTLDDAVLRGTRDIYLLGARKGQKMTVKVSSIEHNAVFDVMAPPNKAGARRPLKIETNTWNGVLPENGDYQVIVGTTRGNAAYRLQVTIK